MLRFICGFLVLLALHASHTAEAVADDAAPEPLEFIPEDLPEGFWELSPRAAALALVRAAYAASGLKRVELGYADQVEAPPARLVVAYVRKLGNNNMDESCVALVVQGQQAAMVGSASGGRYRWETSNPEVALAFHSQQPEQLCHAAKVMWYLGFVRRQDVPPKNHQEQGALQDYFIRLSSTTVYEAITISDGTAPDGGVIGTRSNEISIPLWQVYGPDHHFTLATWLLHKVAGRPPNTRSQRNDGAALAATAGQLLAPDFALPLPWVVLGHAAQAAGVHGSQDMVAAINAHVATFDCKDATRLWRSPFPAGSSWGNDNLIRETLSTKLARARLGEARDRLTRDQDVEYLAEWVRADRPGANWAEHRLQTLNPQRLSLVRRDVLLAHIAGDCPQLHQAQHLWRRMQKEDPAGAVVVARAVPRDHPGHPFALSALRLLEASDPEEAAARVPFLAEVIHQPRWSLLNRDRYIDALVPYAQPRRYEHAEIDAALSAAIAAHAADSEWFPLPMARAALRRQSPEALPLAIALATACIEKGPEPSGALQPLMRFLAELGQGQPQQRELAMTLASQALAALPEDSWDPALISAWALDPDLARQAGPWSEDAHANARRLADICYSHSAVIRASALIKLASSMEWNDQHEPSYDWRWRQQWDAELPQLSAEERQHLLPLAEQAQRGNRSASIQARLKHAARTLGNP